ncbi:hypothetical protein BU15DRAFT_7754, partial [Melanogaster broomeanus]
RLKKSQKLGDTKKQRDKESMLGFPCDGWLYVTITTSSLIVSIHIIHQEAHVPYCPIDIPVIVKDLVKKNSECRPTQLWDMILQIIPHPNFTKKAVYQLWADIDSQKWKRDNDELISVNILLREGREGKLGSYVIEPIEINPEPRLSAIAFTLPEILTQ